jgi:hypothetical protein
MDEQNTETNGQETSQASQDATNNNVGSQSTESQHDGGKTDAFTPTQQTKVQELIDNAYKKAYDKANSDGQKKIEDIQKDIKATEKSQNKKPDALESEAVIKDLEQRAIEAENKAKELEAQTAHTNKQQALLNAIGKHNVTDINMIMNDVMGSVDIDEDGKLFVKNENGNPRFDVNTGGKEYLSLDSYVTTWLNDRPFMLKGNQSQGSGGQSTLTDADGKIQVRTSEDIRNMSDDNFDALIKDGVELKTGTGQTLKFGHTKNSLVEKRKRNFK